MILICLSLWERQAKKVELRDRGMSLYALKLEAELPRLRLARSQCGRKNLGNAGNYFALQAELMAWRIEHNVMTDVGSANALRLFATVMRSEP